MSDRLHQNKWLFLFFLFLFCGCSKPQEEEEELFWMSDFRRGTYSEMGGFQTESGRVYFMDVQNGTKSIICDSVTCSHGRQNCSAYFDGGPVYVALEEDHLLTVTGYGADRYGDLYLYETDVNGSNRKQLAFLGNMQTVDRIQFCKDIIVIAYHNLCDEDLEPLEKRIAGIYVYDRAEQQGKNIWSIEEYNASISELYYQEGKIYFIQVYREAGGLFHIELCGFDLETGEMSVIEPTLDASASEVFVYKDKILYAHNKALWQYDIETKERALATERQLYPVGSYFTEWAVLKNSPEHAFYTIDEGIGNSIKMENVYLFMAFPEVVYAYYCPEGVSNFEVVYFYPEDIRDGEVTDMMRFESK